MAALKHAPAHPHVTMPTAARYVNIAAGAVLFVVGLTPLPGVAFGKIMATAGLVIVLCALLALKEPAARFGTAVAGATLFAAALISRTLTHAGAWLALGLGVIVVAMAFVPATSRSPVHT